MSHISIYEYKIMNLNVLEDLCKKNNISYKMANNGQTLTENLYGRQTANGVMSFTPQGWRYPCVVAEDGSISYDSYGCQSGTKENLNLLMQEYNVEVITSNIDHTLFDSVTKTIDKDGNVIIEMIEY